jgi:dodecin
VADNIYRKTEVVGTSAESVDEAIRGAVRRASESLRQVSWFEVSEIRGHVENGEVGHFQVTLNIGFALEDTKP